MHIADGVLSTPVLGAGAVIAAAGVSYGLWKTDYDRVPRVAMMSSTFFVVSLIHMPLAGTSVHLLLGGLIGLLLGWAAFPALFVALFLQAVLLRHGGITSLGVNVVNMALPAVICHYLFSGLVRRGKGAIAAMASFAAGALAIGLGYLMLSWCLWTTGKAFGPVILGGGVAHLPLMVIEGYVTLITVLFLRKVRPEVLEAPIVEVRHG